MRTMAESVLIVLVSDRKSGERKKTDLASSVLVRMR